MGRFGITWWCMVVGTMGFLHFYLLKIEEMIEMIHGKNDEHMVFSNWG